MKTLSNNDPFTNKVGKWFKKKIKRNAKKKNKIKKRAARERRYMD